jgi:flagellar FliL protein
MAAKKEEPKEEEKDDKKEGDAPAEGGDASAEGAPAEGDAAKSKKKLILFIATPILALAVIGAGLYFTGMLDGLLGKAPVECAEGDEECKAAQAAHGAKHGESAEGEHGAAGAEGGHAAAAGAFLPIPTMIVNLASDDGSPRYLRLTVQLELKSQEDLHAVEAVIPRVIDQFQTYLRELRVRDLRGSAGIYRLQMELLWRVNQAAAPVEVKDVLFQEILIQ